MRRGRLLVFAGMGSVIVLLVGAPVQARRAGLVCGQIVTASVTLSADLVGCPGDGLVAGVSNITIDLGGHTLGGSGAGAGVVIQDAVSVTVKNGSIQGFLAGIRSTSNALPGTLTAPTLAGLRISHNGTGVTSLRDLGLTVRDSSITSNTTDGINLVFTKFSTIRNNLIASNGRAGINASSESDGVTYRDNTVVGNAAAGISVDSSTSGVANNVVTYNGAGGIVAFERLAPSGASGYTFTGNNASNNAGLGISACTKLFSIFPPDDCAARMTDGGGNVASGNSDARQCLNISCGTPSTCATGTVRAGTQTLARSAADKDTGGKAEAFQATAGTDGTVNLVCVFLDRTNAASQLVAGVYGDDAGRPGALLSQGIIPRSLANGAFNTVWIPSIPFAVGSKYWITILSPQGAGTLRFRDHCCGYEGFSPSGPSETSKDRSLNALPTSWITGTRWPKDGPLLGWAGG